MKGSYRIIIQNSKVRYDFEIRRNITIIKGNSATGKTTLIELIWEYYENGEESGIQFSCERECAVLAGRDWEATLATKSKCILFIDEGNRFVHSTEFAKAIQNTDNYYVIVTREGLVNLPYSTQEIYGIRESGKYASLKQVYNELYHLYGTETVTERVVPSKIIVEDSNSGLEFFKGLSEEKNYSVVSANGKYRIVNQRTTIMLQKQRIINEFQKLVSMDSESFCERQIADYLKEKLEAFGFTVSEDDAGEVLTEQGLNPVMKKTDKSDRWNHLSEKNKHIKNPNGIDVAVKKAGDDNEICLEKDLPYTGNLYAFLPGNCEGEPILLAAHMDTVKPGQGKQAILHADGKITSDGSTVLGADDLSGVVSILEALQVIHEEQLPHPDIEILFSVAEELFSLGSRVFDYSQIRAKQAYVFDLSGPVGTAALAAPTILSLDICVNGKDAHAGFAPETGIHSIAIAAAAIAEIQNGRINDTTTVNIGTIHGGDGKNIVPKQCVISGEVRSMDHETALAQAENIRKIFEEKADAYGGTTEMKVTEEVHAYRVDLNNPVVQRFHRACQAAGLSEQLVDTYGGSDNNNFALHGITGIVPACAMENVHSCQEYTCVDELERSARLVLELILA